MCKKNLNLLRFDRIAQRSGSRHSTIKPQTAGKFHDKIVLIKGLSRASTQVGVFLTRYNMEPTPFWQKLIFLILILGTLTLWVKMFIKAYYGNNDGD